jgi:hypothetical protein
MKRRKTKAELAAGSMLAIHRSQAYSESHLVTFRLGVLEALARLKSGGAPEDWALIVECLNLAQVRASQISMALVPPLMEADAVMGKLKDQYAADKTLKLAEVDYEPLAYALEIFDQILVNSSPYQMQLAGEEVKRIINESRS